MNIEFLGDGVWWFLSVASLCCTVIFCVLVERGDKQ